MFTIFLDIDGVLNTRTTAEAGPEGKVGIDDARVEVLAMAIRKYGGADLVLTSDWQTNQRGEAYRYLTEKLAKQGLSISAVTGDLSGNRGAGVMRYLEAHPEIDEYVILDDNTFDFADYPRLWERLILTYGIERGRYACDAPAVETMLFLDDIRACS